MRRSLEGGWYDIYVPKATIETATESGPAALPVDRFDEGQGAALRLGYRIARDYGARFIITADGDGQTDPDDRRASRIRLTPAGRRTIERVRRARRAWLEQLLQGWDDDDLSHLADLLSRFAAHLERDLDDARD